MTNLSFLSEIHPMAVILLIIIVAVVLAVKNNLTGGSNDSLYKH